MVTWFSAIGNFPSVATSWSWYLFSTKHARQACHM